MNDVYNFVDHLINYPKERWGELVPSVRLGFYVHWSELAALEEKVGEWCNEHPVIWNVGIGPAASFVPTLTRLLFERIKDIYGPYDHIIRVRLPSPSAGTESRTRFHQHRLAFNVLTEVSTALETPLPEDIKLLAEEESYFGYSNLSDNLMLRAFGQQYIEFFVSDESIRKDPIYDHQPAYSPILERIREALGQKRHLLLIENLHVPVSMDILVFTMGNRWPSISKNQRWIISTTSNLVFLESRRARGVVGWPFHLTPQYYFTPPFDELLERDWVVLIKEALWDAARSIYVALQDKGYPMEFWLHIAQQCLYYGILYHPGAGHHISSVTSDELVRCWVAENLLFSTAFSAVYPSSHRLETQQQSNYYRSAYEAGMVVMQALQEYSLLPIDSVSTSTVSTSSSEGTTSAPTSSQDVITGVSKLAVGVPRLKQDELNTHTKKSIQRRWVSFMNGDGRHVSWYWSARKTRRDVNMTTLILRGCSDMSGFPLDELLTLHLRVLDLSYTPISFLPPSFSNLLNLYLLSLRGCTKLQTLSPPPSTSDKQTSSPLAHLENLQVLDMNGVPLIELTQQDGSNKSNLHYLDLSGSKFTTLPSEFFSGMSSLEEIIFSNCTNLRELPPSIAQLSNLLVLHVEGTQITSFPEHMFQKMQSLLILKLINDKLLMSLPMSMSKAKGLKVLHLYDCISLKPIQTSLSKAKCLKELHISNCDGLSIEYLWELVPSLEDVYIQTWKSLENIKIHGHANLRTFSLSGPWIRYLSLRGCSKLKILNVSDDLRALVGVDLCGTDIEEVPHNLPNLPQFNMLLLVGVPCCMRFPWHQLVRFPKVFYLDHCAKDDSQIHQMFCQQKTCGDENQQKEKTTNTAQISINDPRMFHSFNEDAANKLVKEGQFLQSFNIQIQPCSVRGKGPRNNKVEQSARIQMNSTYRDAQYLEASSIMPMTELQPMQRHVEISAVNQYPNGLRHILSVTKSIFITDDNFVRCLTDLNYSLDELEECQLQRCHQMTVVFVMKSASSKALPSLQILQVFNLNNLLSLVEPSDLSRSSLITLKLLKHIHVEQCPRLEKMFPCSFSLPALETLVILFCSNLKTIFYKRPDYKVARSPFPNIKSIYLQELPQLLNIHDDVMFRIEMPKWEKLFVRGCQSFHYLPLLKMELEWWERDRLHSSKHQKHVLLPESKVEVSGEHEWWDRLHLKLPEQSDYYLHVPPPEFVSRKKHIIESYLR